MVEAARSSRGATPHPQSILIMSIKLIDIATIVQQRFASAMIASANRWLYSERLAVSMGRGPPKRGDHVGDRVNVGRGDTAAPADQPRPARDPGPDLGR